ncbi:hypothetical protein D3C72_1933000 [compost metagenome]
MSTRLLVPVSPAEPMIIGTPMRREASNISSRSCACQAFGLAQVSLPSGTGPMSSLPLSAAMKSGPASTPMWKLLGFSGAKPRCPLGQMIFIDRMHFLH